MITAWSSILTFVPKKSPLCAMPVEVEDDNNVLFRSRYVVNAAGIHADEISRMMGDDSFTIDGRKGEYILLDRSASGFVQRVVFQAPSALGKGVLVSPTVDGNAFVGPTAVDHSDKEDTSVTQQGIDALKAAGRKSMPDVPLNRPITSFAGVRAVPSTGDFILGQSAANPRLIQAAGISSPGLSSTPAIAMETVESLRKAGLQLQPRGDFNPVREHEKAFRNMTEGGARGGDCQRPALRSYHLPLRKRHRGGDRSRHRAHAGQTHAGRR